MAKRIEPKLPPRLSEIVLEERSGVAGDSFAREKIKKERKKRTTTAEIVPNKSKLAVLFKELDKNPEQKRKAEILAQIKKLQEPIGTLSEESHDEVEEDETTFHSFESDNSEPNAEDLGRIIDQEQKTKASLKILDEQISQAQKDANSHSKWFQWIREKSPEKQAADQKVQELKDSRRTLCDELDRLEDQSRDLIVHPEKAKELIETERKLVAKRLLRFQGESGVGSFPPFIAVPISNAQKAFETGDIITKRLINGELRSGIPTVALSEDQKALVGILGGNTGDELLKIEADKKELKQALRELNDAYVQLKDAESEIERLMLEHPAKEVQTENYVTKRENLGAAIIFLKKQDIPKQIEYLEKALNLNMRMERTMLIKAALESKRTVQSEINKKAERLKNIQEQLTQRGGLILQKVEKLGFPNNATREDLENAANQLEILLDGGKTENGQPVAGLRNDARSAHRIFEQELIRLQDQDNDPKLGKLPLDNWTPWLIDIVRDTTGFGQQTIRRGQERVNVLAREKLLADNGVSMAKAYEELGKSLQGMLNFDPQKGVTTDWSPG